MLRAALLIAYDVDSPRGLSNALRLPILPAVLETCKIFLVLPFFRKGRHTCETSAGPAALVLNSSSRRSGSRVDAVSSAIYMRRLMIQCDAMRITYQSTYDTSIVDEVIEASLPADCLKGLGGRADAVEITDVDLDNVYHPSRRFL